MFGPWMSMSTTPTSLPRSARLTARFVVTVLLPTPPLLLMTRILLRMTDIRLLTSQRLCPSLSFWHVSFSSHNAHAHVYVHTCEAGWEIIGISPGMALSPLDLIDRMLEDGQYDAQILLRAPGTSREIDNQCLSANGCGTTRQHRGLHLFQ